MTACLWWMAFQFSVPGGRREARRVHCCRALPASIQVDTAGKEMTMRPAA
jgi:hypothetical protein